MVLNGGIMTVMVDINGRDEPNTVGLDAFVMDIRHDGTVKDWSEDPALCGVQQQEKWTHIGSYAYGCLSKAMQNNWVITD